MEEIKIRTASIGDAPALLDIYSYYVEHTAVTFEYEPPTLDEFRGRIASALPRYPYLVICRGEDILGFAFAHAFRERPAYDYSVETTIYIRSDLRRLGLGRMIYTALEDELRRMGVTNMYACVGLAETEDEYLSNASPDFHKRMGFKTIGMFRNCGYKFGRWYSMIWMEKIIGEYLSPMPPLEPYLTEE